MGTSATKNHEHQWIFLGELMQTYSKAELRYSDPGISRLEYCGGCCMTRLHMSGDTWAVIQGEATREFLKQFETETSTVVKNPPPELTFKVPAPTKKQQRLGRGLSDLLQEAGKTGTAIPGLFPAKPEKKH